MGWSLRVSPDGKSLSLTGTDTDKTSLELNKWLDNAYRICRAEDPEYVNVLNKIIRRRKVEVVFPQPDNEVERISREVKSLEAEVFLPDPSTVAICVDKYLALRKWKNAGLREETALLSPESPWTTRKAQSLEYPAWLRARQGAGGLMSTQARTWQEAYHWVMFHWQHGLRSDFVAEEYLPGRDFCFMSIWKKGNLITSMARERLSWVGNRAVGTGGTSKLNRVVHSEKVNENAIRSVRAVSPKPHGIFCVDLKESKDGVPLPTEINCRFTTNVHYLTLASLRLASPELNFPWLATRIALGEAFPSCRPTNALPSNLWFTKNTDMGFTIVEDDKWRAADFT